MESFNDLLVRTGEYGEVREVRSEIAVVYGLPHVSPSEVVVFETGQLGEVFSIDKESLEVLVFSKENVRVGTRLTRTGSALKIPVGEGLLGRVINPLGRPIAGILDFKKPEQEREVDIDPPGISLRSRVRSPFLTGVTIVDITVPLGKGQRELVLGDRKTGKSSFLMNTVKNQAARGTIAVYCAIGRRKSDIKKADEFFRKEKISDKTVIVASSFDDPASFIFQAPYTAMTICEYFRDNGKDVLLVLDDMSTHAKFYREISLLSGRFPGRDSYPGDIFHIQAKLLERAGNFKGNDGGDVSITCLPVSETVEDDLGFIVTNLMGMTDGHIFFDSNLYYKGRRPAINTALSVTRVGRQAQSALMREINYQLSALLASYERVQSFSHFGADISESVKQITDTGNKILAFFDQDYSLMVPTEVQLILFSIIWLKMFSGMEDTVVPLARENLIESLDQSESRKMIAELVDVASFDELLKGVAARKEDLFRLCKINKP